MKRSPSAARWTGKGFSMPGLGRCAASVARGAEGVRAMRMRIWPASILATALLLVAATASPLLAIDDSNLVVKGRSSSGHPGTHLGSPSTPGSPGDDDTPNRSGRAPAPVPYVGPNAAT